ncbi:hypothetical protein N7507_003328 [Penicillium longicatenatum]|nr:hypothetical protein N7507_003328 [Penicillium longicatenatum]
MPFPSSSHNRPSRRRDFQIAIICALPLEYDAVSLLVDEFWDHDDKQYGRTSGDMNKYRNGRIGVHDVVLMLLPKMGKGAVAGSTGSLRTSYPGVRIAFLVGVCGGVPSSSTHEAFLGDVVISDGLVEYDFGRQHPSKFIAKQETGGEHRVPNKDIRSLITYLKTEPGMSDLRRDAAEFLKLLQEAAVDKQYRCSYIHPGILEDKLFEPGYHHKHRSNSVCAVCHAKFETFCHEAAQASCQELGCNEAHRVSRHNLGSAQNSHRPCPEIFIGRVASGDTVMKSGEHRDKVAKQYDVIAFEMEGAGVCDELPCIVVKGICDYADSHKSKAWQPFAAATAAAVLKAILRKYTLDDGTESAVDQNGRVQDQARLSDPRTSDLALVQNLGLSNSAELKIGHSLRDAIYDFTNMLTADWRCELNDIKAVPEDDAVLIFTAQLDHQNRDRKGRSIASRLYSVLKSVRDFSTVIETFTPFPAIGSLVWGSIKVTMLIISSSVQYYEALSELFMRLGGLFPRWVEYHVLYKTSTQLQAALCDFYASVIRYCTLIVKKVQIQWQTYFFGPSWQSLKQEFQLEMDHIRICDERLKKELFVAKALADYQDQKLQVKSQRHTSGGRRRVKGLLSRENDKENMESWEVLRDERLANEKRQQLLDSLSTHDYLTPLKQSRRKRHNSTAQWIFSTNEFDRWVKGTGSPLLWCSGKIGSGKTIITASVIDKVLTTECNSNVVVAFFFVQFDDRQSLKAEYILKSIIRQALNKVGVSKETEDRLQNTEPKLTSGCKELLEVLQIIEMELTKFYIIMDGLDECSKSDRDDLLGTFALLTNVGSNIRIFLAGRDSMSREVKRIFPGLGHLFMNCKSAESDIAAYVKGAVHERLQSEDLIVGDSNLIEEIKSSLIKGAEGMFLWVSFQIDELCAQHCDDDIRKAILNFPRDLTGTFNRALGRIIHARNKDIALKNFQWVAAANRPMSLDELKEAFSIEIGQRYSKPERQPNEINRITSWCENLVQVDEEQKLVQFSHHTVQQFLLQKSSPFKEFYFNLVDADHHVGEICVTYLNFNDFKTTVARRRKPTSSFASTAIVQTAVKQGLKSSKPLSVIGKLRSGSQATSASIDVMEILSRLTPDTAETAGRTLTHPFLKYASVNWIFHTTTFRDGISRTWNDWCKMVIGGHSLVQSPWGNRNFNANDPLMLTWGYKSRHYPLLLLITLNGGPSDEKRDDLMQTAALSNDITLLDILLLGERRGNEMERACMTAVIHGHLNLVERLLGAGVDVNAGVFLNGAHHKFLHMAIKSGHFDLVDRLLAAGANVDAHYVVNGEPRTALYTAAKGGHLDITDRLIAAGAAINAYCIILGDRQTALFAAILNGDLDIVSRLLEAGADMSVCILSSGEHQPALYIATEGGHLNIVEKLLEVGADPNVALSIAGARPTVLSTAIQVGHPEIAQMLLKAGADANAKVCINGENQTALYLAAKHGRLDIVEILLEKGADPNTGISRGGRLQTALHAAARLGYLDIVESLLAAGGGMEFETCFGEFNGAALQAAAANGYRRVTERIIAAMSTARPELLQEALLQLARSGRLGLVEKVLAVGANPNYVHLGFGAQTALQAATKAGHQRVVQALKKAGAFR